jgi:hypothetical protein
VRRSCASSSTSSDAARSGRVVTAKAADRKLYDVLTLASIVEREAAVDADRALVAGCTRTAWTRRPGRPSSCSRIRRSSTPGTRRS